MKHHISFLMGFLAIGGCTDKGSATSDDTGGGSAYAGGPHSTAVLATVADDYSVGALATIDLDTWTVTDAITDISADPTVVASGSHLFQLNRLSYDNVRVYTPGSWEEPVSEFALTDQANPQDAAVCEDLVFITQYGVDFLAVYDHTSGLLAGTVDLSAFDDGDGTPEASTLVQAANGRLYVGLEQFDRNDGWTNVGGAVVEIDCASQSVTNSWDTGVSTAVHPYGPDQTQVAVITTGEGLRLLDTNAGTLSDPLVRDEDLGASLIGFAAAGEKALVTTVDADSAYGIGCITLTDWTYSATEQTNHYLIDVQANDRGEAWIGARPHWSSPEGGHGTIVYDIESCASLTGDTMLDTMLSPYRITFY